MLSHLNNNQILNIKRKELTGPGFELMGTTLGDHLHLLETELLKMPNNLLHIKQITDLLDEYASLFDELLSSQADSMNKEIEILMTSLVAALSKGPPGEK